jgi:hypothetical protein
MAMMVIAVIACGQTERFSLLKISGTLRDEV